MRSVRSFVVAVLAVVVLTVPAVVLADGRVALVVGNSTYAPDALTVDRIFTQAILASGTDRLAPDEIGGTA